MEDMYCYVCGEIQCVEKELPRYDCDDHGKVVITDITCCTCRRRMRLNKRLMDHVIEDYDRKMN
jgi:hypothetical protein